MSQILQERAVVLEKYGQAYAELKAALQEFPKEMWQYKPSANDWSIHEIVVHIADSEANSFVRARRFLAEPGKDVMAYDEMGWSLALNYHEQDVDDALELFRWLRNNTYKLVKPLENTGVWSNTIQHPENGLMTLDDWLNIYARHISDHIQQMRDVYSHWQAAGA